MKYWLFDLFAEEDNCVYVFDTEDEIKEYLNELFEGEHDTPMEGIYIIKGEEVELD